VVVLQVLGQDWARGGGASRVNNADAPNREMYELPRRRCRRGVRGRRSALRAGLQPQDDCVTARNASPGREASRQRETPAVDQRAIASYPVQGNRLRLTQNPRHFCDTPGGQNSETIGRQFCVRATGEIGSLLVFVPSQLGAFQGCTKVPGGGLIGGSYHSITDAAGRRVQLDPRANEQASKRRLSFDARAWRKGGLNISSFLSCISG
jgi:hypothetical protein